MRSVGSHARLPAFVIAVMLAGACRSNPPAPVAAAPSGPLADTVPSWCALVPRTALWQITGASPDQTTEQSRKTPTAGSAKIDCDAYVAGKNALGVGLVGGLPALREAGVIFQRPQLRPLPKSLGLAMAENHSPEWSAYALFRCGRDPYWLLLRLNPVGTGRDAVADLSSLALIAERRWGQMNNCTLDPAHPPRPTQPIEGTG
jgi:hypothetical protein